MKLRIQLAAALLACFAVGVQAQDQAKPGCSYQGQDYPEGKKTEGYSAERLCLPAGVCPSGTVVLPRFRCSEGKWKCVGNCAGLKTGEDGQGGLDQPAAKDGHKENGKQPGAGTGGQGKERRHRERRQGWKNVTGGKTGTRGDDEDGGGDGQTKQHHKAHHGRGPWKEWSKNPGADCPQGAAPPACAADEQLMWQGCRFACRKTGGDGSRKDWPHPIQAGAGGTNGAGTQPAGRSLFGGGQNNQTGWTQGRDQAGGQTTRQEGGKSDRPALNTSPNQGFGGDSDGQGGFHGLRDDKPGAQTGAQGGQQRGTNYSGTVTDPGR